MQTKFTTPTNENNNSIEHWPITYQYFDHVVARFCRKTEHVLSDSRIWRQKNSAPDCMTDAPETDASFLAPVSGACVMGISYKPR